MKKVLIAVDNTGNSKTILSLFDDLVSLPEDIALLHVQQLEGNAVMTSMLSDAEVSTLKEALEGTEYKESLDKKAERILSFYRKELEEMGLRNITTIVRTGHPSEEILKVSEEEKVDLIIMGSSNKSGLRKLVTGCASREVEKNAKVPVLIAKGNRSGVHANAWRGREAYAVR